MKVKIPQKNKPKSWELINPIILLECSEKELCNSFKYIKHTYHITPGDSTSCKYVLYDKSFNTQRRRRVDNTRVLRK